MCIRNGDDGVYNEWAKYWAGGQWNRIMMMTTMMMMDSERENNDDGDGANGKPTAAGWVYISPSPLCCQLRPSLIFLTICLRITWLGLISFHFCPPYYTFLTYLQTCLPAYTVIYMKSVCNVMLLREESVNFRLVEYNAVMMLKVNQFSLLLVYRESWCRRGWPIRGRVLALCSPQREPNLPAQDPALPASPQPTKTRTTHFMVGVNLLPVHSRTHEADRDTHTAEASSSVNIK